MNPKELGQSYDQIADRWCGDQFDQSNGIEQHKRALAFLTGKGRALDVGCGCSGRLIDLMLAEGLQSEGVDVSVRMIELARKRHPEVTFHCENISRWDLPHKYDFITAWDSIWHLPLQEQEPVLRKLVAALNPNGILIFTTGGLDQPEEKSNTHMGPLVHYSVLGIPRTLEVIADSGCLLRHFEFDQYPEKHLYLIAQKA